jgi:hypothetical protein
VDILDVRWWDGCGKSGGNIANPCRRTHLSTSYVVGRLRSSSSKRSNCALFNLKITCLMVKGAHQVVGILRNKNNCGDKFDQNVDRFLGWWEHGGVSGGSAVLHVVGRLRTRRPNFPLITKTYRPKKARQSFLFLFSRYSLNYPKACGH